MRAKHHPASVTLLPLLLAACGADPSIISPGHQALSLSPYGPQSVLSSPIVNPANGHIYYLLSQDDWTNSEAFSQTLGGHLATINDQLLERARNRARPEVGRLFAVPNRVFRNQGDCSHTPTTISSL